LIDRLVVQVATLIENLVADTRTREMEDYSFTRQHLYE